MMWDAITITCKSPELASVIRENLEQLQRGGVIPAETLLLAEEDPLPGIGSGGATINALTVMCEHFCVRENLSVLNFDQLLGKRLLIIHAGRDFPYEPLAGVYLPLPCRYTDGVCSGFRVTNFHWLFQLMNARVSHASGGGVWVCSGDMVIDCPDNLDVGGAEGLEVVAFTFPADEETAVMHGVYDVDEDGYLREILYRVGKERIQGCRRAEDPSVFPLVTGLVYLPLHVAEQLLRLYSVPPLDACTYMGADSGSRPLTVSLFFDILASMCSKRAETKTPSTDASAAARKMMRDFLRHSRVRVRFLPRGRCVYLDEDPERTEKAVESLCRDSVLSSFEFCPGRAKLRAVGAQDELKGMGIRDHFLRRHTASVAEMKVQLETELSHLPNPETLSRTGLRPLLLGAVCMGEATLMLSELDHLAVRLSAQPGLVARTLATVADLLSEMADGRGGLRNGPGSNPCWTGALNALRDGRIVAAVEMLAEERSRWMDSPTRMIRAARHYEKATQLLISSAVVSARTFIAAARTGPGCRAVEVRCPARADLSGGWTDAPPVCYEHGGAVVNVSLTVDGRLPIGVRVERTGQPNITIVAHNVESVVSSPEQLLDYDNPVVHGALVKATLVFVGFSHDAGLRIVSWSDLPQGSGLGTSSILAAALLTALWTLDGWSFTDSDVVHGVLIVEQMMTTGGGWQDQIGGLGHGFSFGTSRPGLPIKVEMEFLTIEEKFLREFGNRLVLLFSGKTRLAKNLMQDVIRNWYSRDPVISKNMRELETTARRTREALVNGDMEAFCSNVKLYREQKRIMAPGSETHTVVYLMKELESLIQAIIMAGAGGGGFLVGFLKSGVTRESLRTKVELLKKEAPEMELYDSEIYFGGVSINTEP